MSSASKKKKKPTGPRKIKKPRRSRVLPKIIVDSSREGAASEGNAPNDVLAVDAVDEVTLDSVASVVPIEETVKEEKVAQNREEEGRLINFSGEVEEGFLYHRDASVDYFKKFFSEKSLSSKGVEIGPMEFVFTHPVQGELDEYLVNSSGLLYPQSFINIDLEHDINVRTAKPCKTDISAPWLSKMIFVAKKENCSVREYKLKFFPGLSQDYEFKSIKLNRFLKNSEKIKEGEEILIVSSQPQ